MSSIRDKMSRIVFLITALICLLSCKSNYTRIGDKDANYIPYYLKVYEADSLFEKYEPVNMDNYIEYGIYLNSALKSNHIKKLKRKVKIGLIKYGGIVPHHKSSFEMYLDLIKILQLSEKDILRYKNRYYRKLNLNLRTDFITNYNKDQEARVNGSLNKMKQIDCENNFFLDSVFKKTGFPKKSIIGSNAYYDAPDNGVIYLHIFIIHQDELFRARMLPILYDGIKKGFFEPENYAIVYDRDLLLKKQNQLYGSYECNGSCGLPKNIDSLRRDIGLPHLKYYQWKLNQFSD